MTGSWILYFLNQYNFWISWESSSNFSKNWVNPATCGTLSNRAYAMQIQVIWIFPYKSDNISSEKYQINAKKSIFFAGNFKRFQKYLEYQNVNEWKKRKKKHVENSRNIWGGVVGFKLCTKRTSNRVNCIKLLKSTNGYFHT